MRILALDWGTVRVGAAISDPLGKIAFPLDKFIDSKIAIAEIKKLVEEKDIKKIIIGLPKNLSGEKTQSSTEVEEFVDKLKVQVNCSIVYFDERLSSVGARKILSEEGVSEKKQRRLVDNLAAQQMLQTYLDTRPND